MLAPEVTSDSPDFGHLEPVVEATEAELANAGVAEKPEVALADAGYWHQRQMESVVGRGTQLLIPPDSKKRDGARPGWKGGYYAFMRRVLATEHDGGLHRKTPDDDRAHLREREARPRVRPLPTKRQVRGPLRMAPDGGHPQPTQAPQAQDRPRRRRAAPARADRCGGRRGVAPPDSDAHQPAARHAAACRYATSTRESGSADGGPS